MANIVTITLNPALDCSVEAERVEPVHKVRTFNEIYAAGGGGINVARAITQLGEPALALYFAGGPTGAFLGDLLEATDVRHRPVPISGNTRISHNVFDRATGEDFRFVPEGPVVTDAEVDKMLQRVELLSPKWIVASGSLPRGLGPETYARFVETAQRKGSKLVLDTSGAALKASLKQGGLALIKPSIGELESIGGKPLKRESEAEAAALDLVKSGAAEMVAVTLGKDGGFLADREGIFRVPAPQVDALSAVGAGDSFVGGMVLSLWKGKSPRDAFVAGIAAGSAAVLHLGARLCTREDTDRIHAALKAQMGR